MKNMVMFKAGEDAWVNYIRNRIRANLNFIAIAEGSTGVGKCLTKGSRVLMANGEWKNIEDVKIGDEILSPQKDGSNSFAKVTGKNQWFSEENYDVIQMNRERKHLYSCSHNHQIPLYTLIGKKNKRWIIKNYTAKEISKLNKKSKTHRYIGFSSFPVIEFKEKKNCEIEPYSLGVFLGDGMFRDAKQKGKQRQDLNITSKDFEIISEVSKHYPIMSVFQKKDNKAKTYTFSINSPFSNLLTKYKMNGKKSGAKFIPKEALLSDINYRTKLLAGLIDTDGYFHNGGYEFTLKSKRLVEDIEFLVSSLGGRSYGIKKKIKKIARIGFEGTYYYLRFYLGKIKLPLKTKKSWNKKQVYISPNRIAIDCIKSKPSQVYGIEIDSPSHWFITNNFMVTHNSWAMLSVAHKLNPNFTIDQVAFSFRDVMKIMNAEWFKKMKGVRVIFFDEPQIEISNRAWQSLTNKLLNYLVSTFRHLNIVFLMATPYADFIDSQTQKLIHCKFEVKGHSRHTTLTTIRPKLQQWNSNMKKYYYHSLMVSSKRGVFKMSQWKVERPPEHLIKPYEEKKTSFTSALNIDISQQLEGADKKKRDKIEKNEEKKELTDKQKIALTLKKLYGTLAKAGSKGVLSTSSVQQNLERAKKKGYEPDMWVIPKELGYLAEI